MENKEANGSNGPRETACTGAVYLNAAPSDQEMVREGLFALGYRQYLRHRPYASDYIQAEELARRETRGILEGGESAAALGV